MAKIKTREELITRHQIAAGGAQPLAYQGDDGREIWFIPLAVLQFMIKDAMQEVERLSKLEEKVGDDSMTETLRNHNNRLEELGARITELEGRGQANRVHFLSQRVQKHHKVLREILGCLRNNRTSAGLLEELEGHETDQIPNTADRGVP